MKSHSRKQPALLASYAMVQVQRDELQVALWDEQGAHLNTKHALAESEALRRSLIETLGIVEKTSQRKDELITHLKTQLALRIEVQELQPRALKSSIGIAA